MSEEQPQADEAPAPDAQIPVPAGPSAASATQLKRGPRGTKFENVNDALAYATACYRSGMLPEHIKSPQQAFVIMDNGAELGLKPWSSWRLVYITKHGRISMQSKGALAVVQACPNFEDYTEEIEREGTAEMRAVATAKRKGRTPTVKTFSLQDAQTAGLLVRPKNRRGDEYDGPYQSYLKDMLLARARDRALNVAFAAELAGIELETMAEDADRMDDVRAGVAPTVSVGPPKTAEIDLGAGPPRALPEAKPDPLLMTVLQQQAAPAPEPPPESLPEPPPEVQRQIERDVDEVFGPPAQEPGPKPPPVRTYKVGDIIRGNRRVLEVDEDGHVLMVEKISESEERALRGERDSQARVSASPAEARSAGEEAGVDPAPGSGGEGGDVRSAKAEALEAPSATQPKRCPRDYCGAPLNLLDDCDACGWPSANFLRRS